MPIDFAAIAARFADLAGQDRYANIAGRSIQVALDRRLQDARAAELSSRDMPTLRFEGAALAVRVVTAAAAQGLRFDGPGALEAGWRRSMHAAADLPAFLEATDRLLAAADVSITRYSTPTPDLFTPAGRTVFDIAGVGAAFYAAMQTANAPGGTFDQLRDALTTPVAAPRGVPSVAAGPRGPGTDIAAPAGAATAGFGDEPGAMVLAAALLAASAPQFVSLILAAVDIRVHLMTLDALAAVEKAVRVQIAGVYQKVFATLRGLAFRVQQLVRAIQEVVGGVVAAAMSFYVGFGTKFGAAIGDFVFQVAHFLRAVVFLAVVVVEILAFLGFNFSELPAAPAIGVRFEFPDIGSTLGGAEVRGRVDDIVRTADEGMRAAIGDGFGRAADGLQRAAADFSGMATTAITAEPPLAAPHLDAHLIAGELFPTEPTRSRRDAVAQSFESWLSRGETWIGTPESLVAGAGIGVLIAFMHGYAREVARQWRSRYTEESPAAGPRAGVPAPTSPHILRRHAAPARVQLPRVLIRAGGMTTDDDLDTIAAELADTVRGAYRRAQRRLASQRWGG